jgi:broad specificity phosphatase PhoE
MTRLTWICHGPTSANRQARFPLDEPLEEKAVTDTQAMANQIVRADRVLASPALRARQTAQALGLAAETAPALSDCDYGRWAGHAIATLHDSEPDLVAAWMTDIDAAPHGGESIAALADRLVPWMREQSGQGGHTVAISHATNIRLAVLVALQAPLSSFWNIDVEPLSVVRMTSNGARWSLRFGRP